MKETPNGSRINSLIQVCFLKFKKVLNNVQFTTSKRSYEEFKGLQNKNFKSNFISLSLKIYTKTYNACIKLHKYSFNFSKHALN